LPFDNYGDYGGASVLFLALLGSFSCNSKLDCFSTTTDLPLAYTLSTVYHRNLDIADGSLSWSAYILGFILSLPHTLFMISSNLMIIFVERALQHCVIL